MPDDFPGLQLEENFEFQQKEWRIQRIGWVALLLFAAAALVGVFGTGPLSDTTVRTPIEGDQIRYLRFARYQTPQSWHVRFALDDDDKSIFISKNLLDAMSVEGVFPQPLESTISDDGMMLRFRSSARAASAISPEVELRLRAGHFGLVKGEIGSSPSDAVAIWQFVYP